jgi:hypothetical protein
LVLGLVDVLVLLDCQLFLGCLLVSCVLVVLVVGGLCLMVSGRSVAELVADGWLFYVVLMLVGWVVDVDA